MQRTHSFAAMLPMFSSCLFVFVVSFATTVTGFNPSATFFRETSFLAPIQHVAGRVTSGPLGPERLHRSSLGATRMRMLDPSPDQERLRRRSSRTSMDSVASTIRDVEHHRDVKVLKKQLLDSPIESGKEPVSLEWIKTKLKVEGWTWAVTAFVALLLSELSSSTLPGTAMATIEALFFAFTLNQAKEMNRPSVPEPLSRDVRELWELCIGTVSEGPDAFLSGWFFDAELEKVTLEDVEDFIAWAQFSTTHAKLTRQNKQQVAGIVSLFEEKLERTFQPRGEGEAALPSMRFSIEPMEYVHKPSLFYLSTRFALGAVTQYTLRKQGFTRHEKGAFSYWMRVPKSRSAQQQVPLVFFHGLGVGLVMYLQFVEKLLEQHDGPVMLVELPFVSTHVDGLNPRVPSIDEQLSTMTSIFNEWNIDKALLMGHSYGSLMLSWMIHNAPSRVAGVAFIDPVVLLLNRKDILFNFLYKREGEGKISDIVGTELYINHALRRHFWWYRNILWAQDIQKAKVPSLVCLSENDEIVPSLAVEEHIAEHTSAVGADRSLVSSYMMDDANHGQILFDGDLAGVLASRLGEFVRTVDASSERRRTPVTVPADGDVRVDWLVAQGRWRMRKIGRAVTALPAVKEVGATAALMFMCLGGWQLTFFLL